MKHFTSVNDVKNAREFVAAAGELKKDTYAFKHLGKNKVLGLIFMNPSLRTRLSTQRAAMNLGLDVMVMNFTGEGWALETREGVIMDGDKPEHIKEAAAVIGQYCDIIGLRSFPGLEDRDRDYDEELLKFFMDHSGKPVISLESATLHPLQSLADMITIEEFKKTRRPKVVLTWAPHPKALPQSVPNSFLEWARKMDYDLTIAHPPGYELHERFTGGLEGVNDQYSAFEAADFIYVKNWSSYRDYGKILSTDRNWMVSLEKLRNTNDARIMHCLPVRRNMVIADDVLDSDASLVIEEAGNRIYAAQIVLKEILT
ncbi:MAG: acetylornithine carbamoyltransferase [Cyclobacteriaceae bacterium]|nr:acetylornithine carbamoyltransferase [Cyclobacteriaceae bacterium]